MALSADVVLNESVFGAMRTIGPVCTQTLHKMLQHQCVILESPVSTGMSFLRTVFLVVEKMPYVPIACVSLPYKRPPAEFIAEGTRVLCERVEKDAIQTQRNDLFRRSMSLPCDEQVRGEPHISNQSNRAV